MKIVELSSKHQINDPFITAFMYELESHYGKASKIFKKAKRICDQFYDYDDPVHAISSIKEQLYKLSSKTGALASLKIKE